MSSAVLLSFGHGPVRLPPQTQISTLTMPNALLSSTTLSISDTASNPFVTASIPPPNSKSTAGTSHTGIIAGGIIGGIIIIGLCICCFYRYRKRKLDNSQRFISVVINDTAGHLGPASPGLPAPAPVCTARSNGLQVQSSDERAGHGGCDILVAPTSEAVSLPHEKPPPVYPLPDTSSKSLNPYSDPFDDSHSTTEHASNTTSHQAGGHDMYLGSSPKTRLHVAVARSTARVSITDSPTLHHVGTSIHSSSSSSGTVLPSYKSLAESIPPSFHTVDPSIRNSDQSKSTWY